MPRIINPPPPHYNQHYWTCPYRGLTSYERSDEDGHALKEHQHAVGAGQPVGPDHVAQDVRSVARVRDISVCVRYGVRVRDISVCVRYGVRVRDSSVCVRYGVRVRDSSVCVRYGVRVRARATFYAFVYIYIHIIYATND